ncbi:MAG: bifunctional salicylyl-CoA 5-hydroxylase/oxidoreductase, partial [Caulobacteraceae bacterium]
MTRKARPDWEIVVFEQNRADDTFGFGVVFSDETLGEFLDRDRQSYEQLKDTFVYWADIIIRRDGEEARCSGNGSVGRSRIAPLGVLPAWCRDL